MYYNKLIELNLNENGVYDSVHVIMQGESNSGGQCANTELLASELLARSAIQILYNTDLSELQDLKISNPNSNNVLGHNGLDPTYVGVWHGWEAGLANEVEANVFKFPKVYLTKTGQGGSTVGQWVSDFVGFSTKSINRITATKSFILENNPLHVGWITIGINDAISNTSPENFYIGLKFMVDQLRNQINGNIYITKFDPAIMYYPLLPSYNLKIDQLAEEYSFIRPVNTTGLILKDGDSAHWSTASMKTMVTNGFIEGMRSDYPEIFNL